MIKTALLVPALAALLPLAGRAACSYPAEVTVPNGKTATEEEMAAAQATVKDYLGALEAYQKCIDAEEQALGDSATDEQKAIHLKRYNASVDAMNAMAARYNDEVRAYKARRK